MWIHIHFELNRSNALKFYLFNNFIVCALRIYESKRDSMYAFYILCPHVCEYMCAHVFAGSASQDEKCVCVCVRVEVNKMWALRGQHKHMM